MVLSPYNFTISFNLHTLVTLLPSGERINFICPPRRLMHPIRFQYTEGYRALTSSPSWPQQLFLDIPDLHPPWGPLLSLKVNHVPFPAGDLDRAQSVTMQLGSMWPSLCATSVYVCLYGSLIDPVAHSRYFIKVLWTQLNCNKTSLVESQMPRLL